MSRHFFRPVLLVPAILAAFTGCGGSDEPTGNTTGCESLTGPTIHAADINVSETWTKCGNPHIVRGLLDVQAASAGAPAPILTIGPGVEVRFEVSAAAGTFRFFRIGYFEPGGLVINGTAAEPVTISSGAASAAAGDYTGIVFMSNTVGSSLKHLTIQDCGESPSLSPGIDGCIVAQAAAEPILMQNVTVKRSLTNGVVFAELSEWAAGSEKVNVQNAADYPITTMPASAHTLPSGGTYTGNGRDMILLWGNGDVTKSASWINPGVPYVVETTVDVAKLATGDPTPILTLAPGSTFRMGPDETFQIGYLYAGGLIADGTAAARITFTADSPSPTPAFWVGMEFASEATGSLLDNVVVEYGGGFFGYVPGDEGNILIRPAVGPTITNSIIRNSAECGVVIARYIAEGGGNTYTTAGLGNTFTNTPLGAQCGPYP